MQNRAEKMRILAPLRGVTVRTFRRVFARAVADAGISFSVAPFIPAVPGGAPLRLFSDVVPFEPDIVPQAIGKHPDALREWCRTAKSLGYARADLNAGCPFPMVRNKGRGAGLLKTPDLLERMLEAGCEEIGPGAFSLKVRLGLERTDELEALMPRLNRYPLAMLCIHARTARQMYSGAPDLPAFERALAASRIPVVYNGDAEILPPKTLARFASCPNFAGIMTGRGFVRMLARRPDAKPLLLEYLRASSAELCGDRPVLGRIKELLSYWRTENGWNRLWPVAKICRTVDEMTRAIDSARIPAPQT